MKDIFWAELNKNDKKTSPAAASTDKNNIVEAVNNRIYYYSEVSRQKILILNKSLRNLNDNLVNQANLLSLEEPANIYLHVNSFGGSVFAGLSAVDYVKSCDVPVITIVEGCAASAATLFSVVGTHRQMRASSFMLIHQISSGMWGKYEEMKDDMENCDLFMRIIKDIYHEHTKIPKKKLNEILKRDLWFDAETCLEYGLIDEII
jgi:ATP-dependent Clp protease protease subunit